MSSPDRHIAPGAVLPGRGRWVVPALWAALAALLAGTGGMVLGACGLAAPDGAGFLSFCPAAQAADPRLPRLVAEQARESDLTGRLDRLRLALVSAPDCPPVQVAEAPPSPLPPPEPVTETPPPPEPPPVPPAETAEVPPQPETPRPPEAPRPGHRPTPPPEPQVAERPPSPPAPPPGDDRMRVPDSPRDLAALEGCWTTDPFRHHAAQRTPGVSRYCFDAAGRGTLEWRGEGRVCRSPARIVVGTNRTMYIEDRDTSCSDGSPWWQDRLRCSADAQGVAVCGGESDIGARRERWRVNLHRASRRG